MSRRRPVVVALDPAADPRPSVRWAADEASRRDAELEIVLDVDAAGTGPRADAVTAARAVAPGVPVSVRTSPDPLLHAELRSRDRRGCWSSRGRRRGSRTWSRPRPARPWWSHPTPPSPTSPAPILLAAGPATGIEVVDFAFVEAAARGLPVLAVRCRPAPAAGLGRFLPGPVGAGEEGRQDLAQQLSAWRVAYPDVRLGTLVADEPAAALLLSLAVPAREQAGRGAAAGATPTPSAAPPPCCGSPTPTPTPTSTPGPAPPRPLRATPAMESGGAPSLVIASSAQAAAEYEAPAEWLAGPRRGWDTEEVRGPRAPCVRPRCTATRAAARR